MHDAYEASPILKLTVQIESMAAYDDNLLIGTREGHLLIYNVPMKSNEYGKLELLRYSKNFSKKRIVQVDVVPEYSLLILLTDDIICVHDLNSVNIQQINQLSKTKGATLFALDVQRAGSLTGVRLCVAVKRKLQLYYWKANNNQFEDLGDESRNEISLSDVPRELAWCGETLIVGFHGLSYTLINLDGKTKELFPTGKPPKPSITKLSNSSFALGKDSQSIIMNTTGDLIQHNPVKWTDSPIATVWDDPYLLGIVHDTLEVYTLDGSLHIQTLMDFNKARLLCRCKQGRVYIASIKEEKAKRTYKIQTLYAHHLFCNKKFQEAMKQFQELGTDPYEVIRLFPHLVSQSSNTNDVNEPVAGLPKLQDRDLENGLLALIGFLTEVRHNLMGSTDPKDKDNKTEKNKDKDKKAMTAVATEQLLKIIDTTLLKCYLQTNDAFVAPLLRLNHCHLAEAEKTLLMHQKYPELIILYQTKGQHKKALELLEKQSKQNDSCLRGTERTIQYLQHLGKEHMDLILKFSGWILEQDPEQGLRIFMEDIQEVEQLPRPKVLDYLLRCHKDLVITYLEYVVRVWEDENPLFHNVLVHQYKEKCLASMSLTATPAEKQSGEHVRQKLQQFLEKSTQYTAETVLIQFPSDCLYEERAIILGRLGRHHQAISIYVNLLNDVPRAIQYCKNVYARYESQKNIEGGKCQDGADEVYVTLIQQLLKPEPFFVTGSSEIQKTAQPDLETALELLEQYASKITPINALEVLPDNVPIGRIRHFLEASLHNQLSERRKIQVLKGLLQAEHLQVQEQRMHYESKSVLMTEFNICPVCKKRFGNQSAFARYPNGEIVHYSCQERK
ncbi:hypothetical protein G9C98_007829, partial [Cotesia typhae]